MAGIQEKVIKRDKTLLSDVLTAFSEVLQKLSNSSSNSPGPSVINSAQLLKGEKLKED